MPLATVTLNITTFNASGCCVISRPVIGHSAGNRLKYADPQDPTNFGLVAVGKKGDPLDIAFTIPGYTPGNAVFTPTNTGSANFGQQTIKGSTVTVTNVFANVGKGASMPKWEYAIPVTNAAGEQGTIDPEIENEDANQSPPAQPH